MLVSRWFCELRPTYSEFPEQHKASYVENDAENEREHLAKTDYRNSEMYENLRSHSKVVHSLVRADRLRSNEKHQPVGRVRGTEYRKRVWFRVDEAKRHRQWPSKT